MTIRFPVCEDLQRMLNSEYESSQTLGAVHNQLSDLIEMIDSEDSMRQSDLELRSSAVWARSHIREAIKFLDRKLISELEAKEKERQEKLAIDCMRY